MNDTGTNFSVGCDTCQHKKHPDGGWCYMFREQPVEAKVNRCAQHTGFQVGLRLLRQCIKIVPVS